MAESCIIGFDNRIGEAVLTSGSAAAGRPVTLLANRDTWDSFQSAGVTEAETWIEATWPDLITAGQLSAHATNNTKYCAFRWQCWADAAKTEQVFDQPWSDLCPPMIPWSAREWARPTFYTGRPLARTWSLRPRQIVTPIGKLAKFRVARLEVRDASIAEGFWNVGRLFAGDVIQPQFTFSQGGSFSFDTFETERSAPSGHRDVTEPLSARKHRVTLDFLDEGERAQFLDLFSITGRTGECVWVPHPDDPVKIQRESFLATFARPLGIEKTAGPEPNSLELDLKEWL